MSIMEYNGGAVLAMTGKDCVVIASDKRLGAQALTVSNSFEKVFQMGSHLFLGLTGLATDVLTVSQSLLYNVNMYKLNEEREGISPKAFTHMVSSLLYSKRFGPYFVEPIVAGLDENGQPFVASTDVIGCINWAKDFVVGGSTSSSNLYGMCESLYQPNLEQEDLFEIASQALMNAVDRDALSGWGAVVHIITKDKLITRHLKARQD